MRERVKKWGRRLEKPDYAGDDAGQGLSGTSVVQLIEETALSLDILNRLFSPVTLYVCVIDFDSAEADLSYSPDMHTCM